MLERGTVKNVVGLYLQRLAVDSGGSQYLVRDVALLGQAFDQISTELAHQYTLTYYPAAVPTDGSHRQVTVSIDRAGCSVRARKGYRAPGPAK
jgi:hypothetical protein